MAGHYIPLAYSSLAATTGTSSCEILAYEQYKFFQHIATYCRHITYHENSDDFMLQIDNDEIGDEGIMKGQVIPGAAQILL